MTRDKARRMLVAAVGLSLLVATIAYIGRSAVAQDEGVSGGIKGVKGVVLQPRTVEAKVINCKVTAPGNYKVEVGGLIELAYLYPVATSPPGVAPKEVRLTFPTPGLKVVAESPLGIRQVMVPGLMGGGQIKAFLMAESPGSATVEFMIDKEAYRYEFEVVK